MSEVTRPGYWMYETSGVLRPVVEAYLAGAELTWQQVVVMRAYLRQWIAAPLFRGKEVDALRAAIDDMTTTTGLHTWIEAATNAGCDPL